MGNRAYVVFESDDGRKSPAIYLHWNGGPESVYAFLDAMKRYGCRTAADRSYASARFCQIVGNFFGGTLSLGLECFDKLEEVTPGDNGLYVVGPADEVRRYVGHPARWLSTDEVEQERRAAYRSKYHQGDDNIAQQIDAKNAHLFADDKKKD